MRTAIAIFMMLHGIAHLPGFVVPWRIATLKDAPYKTTLLSGRLDVGDAGIRFIGALWLVVAIGFVVTGFAIISGLEWSALALVIVSLVSLLLSFLSLPEARIGVGINVAILVCLALLGVTGWAHIPGD